MAEHGWGRDRPGCLMSISEVCLVRDIHCRMQDRKHKTSRRIDRVQPYPTCRVRLLAAWLALTMSLISLEIKPIPPLFLNDFIELRRAQTLRNSLYLRRCMCLDRSVRFLSLTYANNCVYHIYCCNIVSGFLQSFVDDAERCACTHGL